MAVQHAEEENLTIQGFLQEMGDTHRGDAAEVGLYMNYPKYGKLASCPLMISSSS